MLQELALGLKEPDADWADVVLSHSEIRVLVDRLSMTNVLLQVLRHSMIRSQTAANSAVLVLDLPILAYERPLIARVFVILVLPADLSVELEQLDVLLVLRIFERALLQKSVAVALSFVPVHVDVATVYALVLLQLFSTPRAPDSKVLGVNDLAPFLSALPLADSLDHTAGNSMGTSCRLVRQMLFTSSIHCSLPILVLVLVFHEDL